MSAEAAAVKAPTAARPAQGNQFGLLARRRFGPFFATQFLGAFNDNVFRNALVILITFQAARLGVDSDTLVNICGALFILPFFLFSATVGQFVDKYEKSMQIRLIKGLEVVIMLAAAVAFYFQSVYVLVALLFMMGTQSALFGPIKYSILPQTLERQELVGGNGLIQMGTFLAILMGLMLGGILIGLGGGDVMVGVAVVAIALLGLIASFGIPRVTPTAPDLKINWNPLTETWRNLSFIRTNRTVFLSVLGVSWFWYLGFIYQVQLPNYTQYTLGGDNRVYVLLLTLFSVGIGVGSLLCERLSGRRVELGLVPFGSIGLTVFGVDLYFAAPEVQFQAGTRGVTEFLAAPGSWRVALDLVLVGVFGGFYIVPLNALIQSRSEPSHRSRVIAGNNIINAFFMVLATITAIVLLRFLSIPQLFLVMALLNAVVAVYIYTLVPEFLMRFLVWILIHLVYRVSKEGVERIPEEGPAVLVCNHVSYVDALIIAGCCPRPVRFIMYHGIYRLPVLNFVFRTAGAIPIAPAREDPALRDEAFRRIDAYLQDGEVVCIFPEGALTRGGNLQTFRPGIETIIARNPVPVIPMALRGLWGSFFSRRHGMAMRFLPRRFWSRIGLWVGEPQAPGEVSLAGLQEAVASLRGDWQ